MSGVWYTQYLLLQGIDLFFTTFILLLNHGRYNTIADSIFSRSLAAVSDHLSPSAARLPLLGPGGSTPGKASSRIRLSEMENIFHAGCHKTVTFGHCLIANLYLTSNLSIRNERYYLSSMVIQWRSNVFTVIFDLMIGFLCT